MRNHLVTLIMIFAFLWLTCHKNFNGPANFDSIPDGAYSYISYNSNWTALVSGWFTMIQSDSGTISGEWHFKPIGNPENIGPQIGDGILVGGTFNGGIWVELNPQFRDDNLQLTGIIEGKRYSGQWVWITLTGITNQGRFVANRN